jgi:hypothetical protein
VSELGLRSILIRVSSCDFVDRVLRPQKNAIHEITRINTNEASPLIPSWKHGENESFARASNKAYRTSGLSVVSSAFEEMSAVGDSAAGAKRSSNVNSFGKFLLAYTGL